MIQQFFIPPYFVSPNLVPRGVYGSSGRNIISGPATNRTDLSLMKDMVIREQCGFSSGASFQRLQSGDSRRSEHFRLGRKLRPDYQRQLRPRSPGRLKLLW